MFCPDLITMQKAGVPLTQEIKTIKHSTTKSTAANKISTKHKKHCQKQ